MTWSPPRGPPYSTGILYLLSPPGHPTTTGLQANSSLLELSRSFAPSMVVVYVAAVALLHHLARLQDPTHNNTRLQQDMRGVRQVHTAPASNPRRPVTTTVLTDFHHSCDYTMAVCTSSSHSHAGYVYIRNRAQYNGSMQPQHGAYEYRLFGGTVVPPY